MSENIDNDAVAEDVTVEEAAVVEETAEVAETPVAEEAPVVEETPVIEEPKAKTEKKPATNKVEDFVNNKDAVVVYASRELRLNKLGKTLTEGFNVVPISEARHWLALASVRPATPEEVTKEFGK